MNHLLIVGTIAFDSVETPFAKADHIVAGSATYIGLSASMFRCRPALVSVIGEDFPEHVLKKMEGRGIDLSAVKRIKGGKTFYWSGKYGNDLNTRETLVTDLNVLADFEPVIPEHLREAPVVMLGNLDPDIQLSVLDQMKRRPKLVVLDTMNYWINHSYVSLLKIISRVDVLALNDEEARQLTGEYSLVRAAQRIQKMGPSVVLIKKGEHGALLFSKSHVFFAPAFPLEEVFDPTGAGDTFAGGFTGYLSQSLNFSMPSLKNAVISGSNLASFCVERMGTERMWDLSREEILMRVELFKDLTQFQFELDG